MTAAAVGPSAPRGLPGRLWHRVCERGNPCPSLYSCPHPCTWGPGQIPSPVLASPRPFRHCVLGAAATVLQPRPSVPCLLCSHPRCQRSTGSWAPGPSRPGQTASCRVNRGKLLCAGLGCAAGAKLCVSWAMASSPVPLWGPGPRRPQRQRGCRGWRGRGHAVRVMLRQGGIDRGGGRPPSAALCAAPAFTPLLSASPVPGCVRGLDNRRPSPLGARRGGVMGDGQCPRPGPWAVGVTAGLLSVPPPPLGQGEPSRGAAPA